MSCYNMCYRCLDTYSVTYVLESFMNARPLADAQRSLTLKLPLRLIAARRRLTPRARLHYPPRLASKHDGPPGKGLPQSLSGKTP